MKRIAIVEDDQEYQDKLTKFLRRYGEENGEDFQISYYQDGIDFVDEYVFQYEIILLDIKMKFMDGMDMARKIREKDGNVLIIFITNLAEYAIQGYDVAARGFVLKPVTYRAFSLQIQKVCKEINEREDVYVSISFQGGIRKILQKSIYYIESQGHYLNVYLQTETITFYLTLKEFEKKLDTNRFCRCNNGTIVNLQHVQKVEGATVYVNKIPLSISRAKKKAFMEALTDYIGEGNYV